MCVRVRVRISLGSSVIPLISHRCQTSKEKIKTDDFIFQTSKFSNAHRHSMFYYLMSTGYEWNERISSTFIFLYWLCSIERALTWSNQTFRQNTHTQINFQVVTSPSFSRSLRRMKTKTRTSRVCAEHSSENNNGTSPSPYRPCHFVRVRELGNPRVMPCTISVPSFLS